MGESQRGAGNAAAPHPYAIGVDRALSAQVRQELLETLRARTQFDPAQAERELEARDVHAEFIRQFGDLGLVPDNLPDLLAGHLMAMWSVVHNAALPDRDVAAALVRQFTGMIAPSPLAADPGKRQLMGEALLYEAVLTLEAQAAARGAGHTSALKEMAESAQRNFLAQRAINLRRTRLTKTGMVRT
ncbi:MAG: hypothetical protein ABI843_07170 [Dokdonella sp.]